jgi:hypothetical protein
MRVAAIVVLAGFILTSCTTGPHAGPRWRCAVDYSLPGASSRHLSLERFEAGFGQLGIQVVDPDEEDTCDFSVTVAVSNFKATDDSSAFCSFEYRIYYRDTMFSIVPEIQMDGELDAQRVDLALEYLNRQLLFLLEHYPIPPPATADAAGDARD